MLSHDVTTAMWATETNLVEYDLCSCEQCLFNKFTWPLATSENTILIDRLIDLSLLYLFSQHAQKPDLVIYCR